LKLFNNLILNIRLSPRIYTSLFLILIASVLLASCVPHRELLILQNKKAVKDSSAFKNPISAYKIQPGDVLSIEISSSSSNQLDLFNKEFSGPQTMQSNEASVFLKGHIVSEKGEIELPLIGVVSVTNLTTDEISIKVKEKLEEYISYTTVSTKLTNYRITILGEVRHPGTFLIYNSNFNVLQALGLAGDITEIGNKHKVKLIRKTPDGSDVFLVDVSNEDIIGSPNFYLYPNDVVYVQPMKAKVLRVNTPAIQATISLITLVFLVLNFTKR
jgi:polysaccharide biosynthesis/export protein